jgi:acyl CoA:acetate/3-ketoacid CoA transferase beta subunit
MYINAKMIPVKTVPGMGEKGMKESNGGVNSTMIYLEHCKNLCKYSNVSPPSTTTIKKKNKNKREMTSHM